MQKINARKRILIAVLTALLFLYMPLFCACQRKAKKFTVQAFDCFDTVTTIMGYAETQAEFDAVAGEILAELSEYHKLFTIYEQYEGLENLYTINQTEADVHRTVTVDERIIDMLLFAKEMYALTDGKVNVAMGRVLSLWHTYREAAAENPAEAKLPPMAQLLSAAEHTDIDDLIIDAEQNTVTLRDPLMSLDVGAIAKGYAVEMAARALESRGITGYLINVGGNVRAVGAKASGEGWTVGIQNPEEDAEYLAYLTLFDSALVTSGSYQRYYTVDGKRYHHIIDPETGMPSERYTSVSILCENSAMGDALSTALFCMSLEDGRALIASLDGVEAMWVTADGELYTSDGFDAVK